MQVGKNFTNLSESLTKVLVAILLSNTHFLKYTYTSVKSILERVQQCEEERIAERDAAAKRSEDKREED